MQRFMNKLCNKLKGRSLYETLSEGSVYGTDHFLDTMYIPRTVHALIFRFHKVIKE